MKRKFLMTTGLLGLAMFGSPGCSMYGTQARTMTAPTSPIVAKTSGDQIPAGTELSIRTDVDIDTQKAGGTFEAELAQAVVNENGHTLIPRGTPAQLVVTDVSDGGVTGTKTMELALRSLVIDNRIYSVKSASDEERGREGLGANQRTTEALGGGALLGAVIGGAFGGPPGAAVGAAAGAVTGATGQVLTRGKAVKVPAETVLKFRLNQPISVA